MVTIHDFDDNRAFVDLVCADPELLRAEFDGLVAACWDSPPRWPPRPKRAAAGTGEGKPSDAGSGCQPAARLLNPATATQAPADSIGLAHAHPRRANRPPGNQIISRA